MRTLLLVLLLHIPHSLRPLRRGSQTSDTCRLLLLLLLLLVLVLVLVLVLHPKRGPRHGCMLGRPGQASQQV